MFSPRYSQGSGGDCFFRLPQALLLSLLLHLLLLFSVSSPGPQSVDKPRFRIAAELSPGANSAYLPGAESTPAAAPRQSAPLGKKGAGSSAHRERAGSSLVPSATPGDDQEAPSVMAVAAYRLAVGRIFSSLLDARIRARLPVGEMLFKVRGRLGHSPEVSVLSPTDPGNSGELRRLMEEAVARVAMPVAWQSRGYSVELRALVSN